MGYEKKDHQSAIFLSKESGTPKIMATWPTWVDAWVALVNSEPSGLIEISMGWLEGGKLIQSGHSEKMVSAKTI